MNKIYLFLYKNLIEMFKNLLNLSIFKLFKNKKHKN
jgi:hypothetical protein